MVRWLDFVLPTWLVLLLLLLDDPHPSDLLRGRVAGLQLGCVALHGTGALVLWCFGELERISQMLEAMNSG